MNGSLEILAEFLLVYRVTVVNGSISSIFVATVTTALFGTFYSKIS